MYPRRVFLLKSSLALAGVAIARPSLGQLASSHAILSNPENQFVYSHGMMTQAAFTRQLGSTFRIVMPDSSRVTMRLRSVSGVSQDAVSNFERARNVRGFALRPPPPLPAADAPFKVTFELHSGALTQGSYVVESGVYGPGVIFLVPGSANGRNTCSAVFNPPPTR